MAEPQGPEEEQETTEETDAQADAKTAGQPELAETVGDKALRRLAAQGKGRHSLWYGLGAFGLIGWSITVPTLIGAAIGLWLDNTVAAPFSWTLALLLAGVVIGIFNAWYWMSQEQQEMESEKKERMQERQGRVEQAQRQHRDGTENDTEESPDE